MDVWEPYSQKDINKNHYFLFVVDDFTKSMWTFLLKSKYEVFLVAPQFHRFVQNQFHTNIKQIRSDNGTEFNFDTFFASYGIMHQTSCVYTLQQNGVVERKHQHLLNVARALLFHSKLLL